MSDERDGAGSMSDEVDDEKPGDRRGQTAVVTRPARPTGKRPRREAEDVAPETDAEPTKNGNGKKPRAAKKSGPSSNPISFVITFLSQVVTELRKVIWPNRKQMVSYTTVVLLFLAFMVALIGGVDLGLTKLVSLVFG